MKKLLFVLGMLIIGLTSDVLKAQTNVGGIISSNTTWSIAGSPYIVTGNVLLDSGYTLTIQPGVTIKFNRGLSLQINGTLVARGTSTNRITFTSNVADSAGTWGYIYFSEVSTNAVFENNINGIYLSGSILEYCNIYYAGGATVSYNGAVRLNNAHPFINYCNISYNSATGIYGNNLSASLKITNSSITHNSGGGMDIEGGTSVIENDTISDNIKQGNGAGIFTSSSSTISHNVITNNICGYGEGYSGGGIYVWGSYCNDVISDNIIMNNTLPDGSGGGIYYTEGNNPGGVVVSKNLIINNKATTAAGIYNYHFYSYDTIYYNIIADNISANINGGIGTTNANMIRNNHIVRNTATNNAGINANGDNIEFNTIAYNNNTDYNNHLNKSISVSGTPVLNNNNIFNNSAFYEMHNSNLQGTPDVNASNNWWGTANNADVQAKIYDWIDDGSLGIIKYSPFKSTPDTMAPVSPPANVIKTNLISGSVKITWNRNPEADITGYHLYYRGFNGYSFANEINIGTDTSYILSGVSISDTIGVTAYDRTYSITHESDSTIVNDNMTNGNESWYSFARDTSKTTGITKSEVPSQYSLQQNYPNPFNPTTTIKYSLQKAGNVRLTVYNAIGSKVATIVNEYKPAGNYSVQFNGSNLASGIYLYRLESGQFSQVKKMILLK